MPAADRASVGTSGHPGGGPGAGFVRVVRARTDAEVVECAEDLRVAPEQPRDEERQEREDHSFEHHEDCHC